MQWWHFWCCHCVTNVQRTSRREWRPPQQPGKAWQPYAGLTWKIPVLVCFCLPEIEPTNLCTIFCFTVSLFYHKMYIFQHQFCVYTYRYVHQTHANINTSKEKGGIETIHNDTMKHQKKHKGYVCLSILKPFSPPLHIVTPKVLCWLCDTDVYKHKIVHMFTFYIFRHTLKIS